MSIPLGGLKRIYFAGKSFLRPGNIKGLYFRYEAWFSPAALLAGFVVDNLTLRRIDLLAENLVIISYLAIALLSILFLSLYEAGRLENKYLVRLAKFTPFVLQFSFGGLFSAFFVFYRRSSSLAAGWPFLIIILALLVGNEGFRERYQRLTFRLSVFFMALFSYSVFAWPVLLSKIGPGIFLLSGLFCWLVMALIVVSVHKAAPEALEKSRISLPVSLVLIYLGFNILYFTNLIPPIPLSLQSSGVYHSLSRSGGSYELCYEKAPWYFFWQDYSPVFHWRPGERVYYFTAIFAPAEFNLPVYHHWQYFDEESSEWISSSRLGFPISGGRDRGYRGYSYKQNVKPGKWRIDTMAGRGRIMGRTVFTIEPGEAADLETIRL